MTGVGKITAERSRRVLLELVLEPGNDICADCKARAPRWASYNLGIFICVSCASIHRKIGTHVTKVKSITLDQWNKEQVEVMKEKGNIKSNALYNPNEARHPPPTNMLDSERDSELEKFIRSKYEFKRFMDRTSQQSVISAASIVPRSRSTPLTNSGPIGRQISPGPLPPPKTPENLPPRLHLSATIPSQARNAPFRSASQPLPPLTKSDKLTAAHPLRQPAATQPSLQKPAGQVWEDLISLQGPSESSSLPLQYSPMATVMPFPSQPQVPVQTPGNATNPFMNLSLGQSHMTTPLVTSPMPLPSPGTQFSFVPSAPLSSPALHLGVTNPFNQAPMLSCAAVSANGTFSTSSNPFSLPPMTVPMIMSTPTTFSAQPLATPPLPYTPSQAFTPTPSFPPTPYAVTTAPVPTTAGLAQNPFATVNSPGQIPFSTNASPFSTMQMGQAGFPGANPQIAFGPNPSQQQTQQQLHPQQQQYLGPVPGFGRWAGQGAQGTL